MEERNLELDDDGKIRIRTGGALPQEGEREEDGEIVIETPAFEGESAEKSEQYSEEDYLRRRAAREQEESARRDRARALCEEGEALLADGKYDEAGVCFLDSAALGGSDWRPWFGVVRVHTRDLTDFSQVYDCEQAYDKALRRMSREARAAIAERYVPSLRAQADALAEQSAALSEQDERERKEAEPACRSEAHASAVRFFTAAALFGVFLIAAAVLWPLINSVEGVVILVPAIVCSVFAVGLLVPAALFCQQYVLARIACARNRRAGSTDAGEQARILAERAEVIRSVIEDFEQ